ncbi:nuclease [Apophysomyces sp. BC1034]|nr:nuclease [Apophysomyces sp. BC1015]KAG0179188.1 nuclease [Apophysomyces sp. BC1021]KAG0190192.1 nuclease [Apophysomyces sp. BC1034]
MAATERVTYLVGGAALGALSMAAYNKYSQKPRSMAMNVPPPRPQQLPPPPAPPAQLKPRSPDLIEKAKTIMPFGFPGPVSDIVYRNAYVASYNRRDRNPNWVAEHLTAESLKRAEGVERSKSQFKEDDTIPPQFRARLADYYKSNFDRGHMVPAADVKNNQEAMNETFYLTNISPQVGDGFNRDYWAHLESFCRSLTKSFADVYVFTGPLYLPHQENDGKFYVKYQVIGNPPNVAVPTHFYKVIMTQRNGKYSVGAFVLPNHPISDDTPLEQFKVPLDAVERGAGLTFFDRMDKSGVNDLCKETKCQVVLSKFHEAKKKNLISA